MARRSRFSLEVRERAVRMVLGAASSAALPQPTERLKGAASVETIQALRVRRACDRERDKQRRSQGPDHGPKA